MKTKNRLQALIGAIKNIYTIIQSKLRLLTCWQQAVGKTDCTDDVSCDCKKKNISIINEIYVANKFDMAKKIEINKVLKLSDLTDNLRKHSIGYSELNDLKDLCGELSTQSQKDKIDNLIKTLGYKTDIELVIYK